MQAKADDEQFIVAEISRNWTYKFSSWVQNKPGLISNDFEMVINTNSSRGYKLIDWKISTCVHQDVLNETIIAIFEKNILQ